MKTYLASEREGELEIIDEDLMLEHHRMTSAQQFDIFDQILKGASALKLLLDAVGAFSEVEGQEDFQGDFMKSIEVVKVWKNGTLEEQEVNHLENKWTSERARMLFQKDQCLDIQSSVTRIASFQFQVL